MFFLQLTRECCTALTWEGLQYPRCGGSSTAQTMAEQRDGLKEMPLCSGTLEELWEYLETLVEWN